MIPSLLIWIMSGAWAQPACDVTLRAPDEALSVSWVSPLRQRVGRRGWVRVVPTAQLRAWVREEAGGSLARTLQRLGLRRSSREPRRRFKVTVFDVRAVDLCRPLDGYDDPAAVEGAVTCLPRLSKPDRRAAGCGATTDRESGDAGLELFFVRWEDAARNGFCVLPATRFLATAG